MLTDHGPLKWLCSTTAAENSPFARYALRLQAYDPWVETEYKPGRENLVADATSMFTVDLDVDVKSMGTLILRCEVCKGVHTPFVDTGVEPLKLFHGFPGRARRLALCSYWSSEHGDMCTGLPI